MKSNSALFCLLNILCTQNVLSFPSAKYPKLILDQRQTGKYNIHISLKDITIIEVGKKQTADETYDSEEYYYDDDDLTIKPLPTRATTEVASTKFAYSTTEPTRAMGSSLLRSEILISRTNRANAEYRSSTAHIVSDKYKKLRKIKPTKLQRIHMPRHSLYGIFSEID